MGCLVFLIALWLLISPVGPMDSHAIGWLLILVAFLGSDNEVRVR